MARGGAQHRPGDGVELRLAPGGDVALHRAAEGVVGSLQLGDRGRRIDVLGALGFGDGAGLLDRAHEVGAQLRRGKDLPQQLVVGTGGAGERIEPHEL